MGKLYKSYPAALAADPPTECRFQLPFAFKLPSLSFPPPIPFPVLVFPTLTIPFWCPLD